MITASTSAASLRCARCRAPDRHASGSGEAGDEVHGRRRGRTDTEDRGERRLRHVVHRWVFRTDGDEGVGAVLGAGSLERAATRQEAPERTHARTAADATTTIDVGRAAALRVTRGNRAG